MSYLKKSFIICFSQTSHILFNNYHSHFDVINRSISTSSSRSLNHFNHVEAFFYLTKYSVLAVKMGYDFYRSLGAVPIDDCTVYRLDIPSFEKWI